MDVGNSKPTESKADALRALVSGPLSAAEAKLFGRSRAIPSGKDFHFFNNFGDFKAPVKEIRDKSESSLRSITDSGRLWGSRKPPQFPDDVDDAYDWLVNLNDEFLERFAFSMDEFRSLREEEEGRQQQAEEMDSDGGFQLVYGKKKKKARVPEAEAEGEKYGSSSGSLSSSSVVNVASRDKRTTGARSKVPFHIPTIPRPQDEYRILVNNQNLPFDHVWLEKSEDGRYIHPLEKLSVLDFVDRNLGEDEPAKPLLLESTAFKLVERVNNLKELAAKLRLVNEFAVDLEHNHYRSFQGLTCLMQISTRTEDFVVDTLKLRVQVGPYLREVFKDPSKRKVMHGADHDILWLQKDFGIYVCNLFDTGQASRVLQMERNSLEYLLNHFCGVTANKEYQNADWRLRPLPAEMLKYAREDTHYLLYVYDQMKRRLLSASSNENDLLVEVYKRSADICMQLYEKELLTDSSYLYIYGLSDANFNANQLAVVAGLCKWRDNVARAEDESTGYVLPNKALLEIAKQMPLTSGNLRRLVKSKHPFVERYLNSVLGIIKSSIANSAAFESAAEQLKKGWWEASQRQNMEAERVPASYEHMHSAIDEPAVGAGNLSMTISAEPIGVYPAPMEDSLDPMDTMVLRNSSSSFTRVEQADNSKMFPLSETRCSGRTDNVDSHNGSTECTEQRKVSGPSVQLLKKPSCAFGALFGNLSSTRKLASSKGTTTDQEKNENKVQQIKSSVALPFHYFSGRDKFSESNSDVVVDGPLVETQQPCSADTAKLEEVILLENESDHAESPSNSPTAEDGIKHGDWSRKPQHNRSDQDFLSEFNVKDVPMSLSDLSSGFDKCFKSVNERRGSQNNRKPSQDPHYNLNFTPFDYAAARKNMNFGAIREEEARVEDGLKASSDSREKRKGAAGKVQGEERSRSSQQPRRRQAFPPSGNRSMTFH